MLVLPLARSPSRCGYKGGGGWIERQNRRKGRRCGVWHTVSRSEYAARGIVPRSSVRRAPLHVHSLSSNHSSEVPAGRLAAIKPALNTYTQTHTRRARQPFSKWRYLALLGWRRRSGSSSSAGSTRVATYTAPSARKTDAPTPTHASYGTIVVVFDGGGGHGCRLVPKRTREHSIALSGPTWTPSSDTSLLVVLGRNKTMTARRPRRPQARRAPPAKNSSRHRDRHVLGKSTPVRANSVAVFLYLSERLVPRRWLRGA